MLTCLVKPAHARLAGRGRVPLEPGARPEAGCPRAEDRRDPIRPGGSLRTRRRAGRAAQPGLDDWMRTNGGPGFEERSLMIPKGCVFEHRGDPHAGGPGGRAQAAGGELDQRGRRAKLRRLPDPRAEECGADPRGRSRHLEPSERGQGIPVRGPAALVSGRAPREALVDLEGLGAGEPADDHRAAETAGGILTHIREEREWGKTYRDHLDTPHLQPVVGLRRSLPRVRQLLCARAGCVPTPRFQRTG
jgi:hypothetical protein